MTSSTASRNTFTASRRSLRLSRWRANRSSTPQPTDTKPAAINDGTRGSKFKPFAGRANGRISMTSSGEILGDFVNQGAIARLQRDHGRKLIRAETVCTHEPTKRLFEERRPISHSPVESNNQFAVFFQRRNEVVVSKTLSRVGAVTTEPPSGKAGKNVSDIKHLNLHAICQSSDTGTVQWISVPRTECEWL